MKEFPEKYRHDLAIIRETATLLIRDFEMHGVTLTFSGSENNAWEELHMQLCPALAGMYADNRNSFRAILYQVDISEAQFRKLTNETTSDNFISELASLIIQREFQKILTRRFFSAK